MLRRLGICHDQTMVSCRDCVAASRRPCCTLARRPYDTNPGRSTRVIRVSRAILRAGEVAERSNAAVLKTVDRKIRGFESHPLRHEATVFGGDWAQMGRVTITPIYTAAGSNALVETMHVHAEDEHVPMREIQDVGHGVREAPDATAFRYTVHECPRTGCGVRVTTSLLHKVRLAELKGLVIEHENGRLEMYGDVPDDWRTNERRAITD
jgi:hypothetical protein